VGRRPSKVVAGSACYERDGRVETWMGIGQGRAAAADSNGRVIREVGCDLNAGVWHLAVINKHPDFLWTPLRYREPCTPLDRLATGAWNLPRGLPESRRDAGLAAARQGQPLKKIVTLLFDLAR
jgi:hypothetical protein